MIWEDVPEPAIEKSTDVLVRPFIAARCDLDSIFLNHPIHHLFRLGRILRQTDPDIPKLVRSDLFKGPFPMGHEGIAEVVDIGREVRKLRKGDAVIVPFQISCGQCPICAAGLTSQCEKYGPFDMLSGIGKHTQRGGMISDLLKIPNADHLLIKVPPEIQIEGLVSASDNLPDAWSRVAPYLLHKPNKKVLIMGGSAKSVGLYAAAFAAHMQVKQLDYLDTKNERLAIATKLGANALNKYFYEHEDYYDLIVNASSSTKAIDYGLRHLNPGGTLSSSMIYLNRSIKIPYFRMYAKNLTLTTGLANPLADIPEMLAFIKAKEMTPALITTHQGHWEDGHKDLLQNTTKVILNRAPIKLN